MTHNELSETLVVICEDGTALVLLPEVEVCGEVVEGAVHREYLCGEGDSDDE
jgi:hypothetical protein